MTLYRNALRALNIKHVRASKLVARRFYSSLGEERNTTTADENVSKTTSLNYASQGQSPREKIRYEADKAKEKFPLQLADIIRPLMRRQAHGLAAVVAPSEILKDPHQNPTKSTKTPGGKSGLLVSSLNTVTLSPVPYISFNIKVPSTTYNFIRDFGAFMVSGLDDPIAGFALTAKNTAKEREEGNLYWTRLVDGKGRVESNCGGTWWMKCMYHQNTRVGDHLIVVAQVLEAGSLRENGRDGDSADGTPANQDLADGMVYMDGSYRYVGRRMPLINKRFSKTFNGDERLGRHNLEWWRPNVDEESEQWKEEEERDPSLEHASANPAEPRKETLDRLVAHHLKTAQDESRFPSIRHHKVAPGGAQSQDPLDTGDGVEKPAGAQADGRRVKEKAEETASPRIKKLPAKRPRKEYKFH